MTGSRYEVIVYWSGEDEAFIAEVPELPDCAADGPTYAEALVNAQGIVEEWIETARELGCSIPEPGAGLKSLSGTETGQSSQARSSNDPEIIH